jgi:hypothetical protein
MILVRFSMSDNMLPPDGIRVKVRHGRVEELDHPMVECEFLRDEVEPDWQGRIDPDAVMREFAGWIARHFPRRVKNSPFEDNARFEFHGRVPKENVTESFFLTILLARDTDTAVIRDLILRSGGRLVDDDQGVDLDDEDDLGDGQRRASSLDDEDE